MAESSLAGLYPPSVCCEEKDGKNIPLVYRDVETEVKTIRKAVGLIDGFGFGILRISGKDAGEFLDRLCTKDILYANPGECTETLLLNEDGQVAALAWIVEHGGGYYMLLLPEQAEAGIRWVKAKAQEVSEDEDISIKRMDPEWTIVFLEGRDALSMTSRFQDWPAQALALRGTAPVMFETKELLMIRNGRTGERSFAWMGESGVLASLAGSMLEAFEKEGLSLCGEKAVRICMMEIGQPAAGFFLPGPQNIFELGWQWMIQHDKEEYCGKEGVDAQFKTRRRTRVCFTSDDTGLSFQGRKVFLEEEEVGMVLEDCADPELKKRIGTVLLDKEIGVPGIALRVETEKKDAQIETVSSPIVRPASWDDPLGE